MGSCPPAVGSLSVLGFAHCAWIIVQAGLLGEFVAAMQVCDTIIPASIAMWFPNAASAADCAAFASASTCDAPSFG